MRSTILFATLFNLLSFHKRSPGVSALPSGPSRGRFGPLGTAIPDIRLVVTATFNQSFWSINIDMTSADQAVDKHIYALDFYLVNYSRKE